jgi:hypothetical protein
VLGRNVGGYISASSQESKSDGKREMLKPSWLPGDHGGRRAEGVLRAVSI